MQRPSGRQIRSGPGAAGYGDRMADVGATGGRFDVLRIDRYRTLFLSGAIVFMATHAQQIARGWLAKELSGSNAGIGAVYFAFGIAMMVASPMAGVIADRFPKRSVVMFAQSVLLAGAAVIAVGHVVGVLRYWMLIVASLLHGFGMAILGPARMSFTTDLIDRAMLPNAIVLSQMSVNATRIIGPSIAGAMIGIHTIGAGGVYLFTSVLIAIAVLWTSTLPRIAPRGATATQSPGRAFTDGVRYVRSKRELGTVVAVANLIAIIGLTYVAFLPKVSQGIFDRGASGYSRLSIASAFAALGTSFWIAGQIGRRDVRVTQAMFGTVFSVALVVLAAAPGFWAALAIVACLGGASSGFQVTNSSLAMMIADADYQGRVQALLMLGFSVSSMAALPVGVLADHIGLRETFGVLGIACCAVMIWYWAAAMRINSHRVIGSPS